MAILLEWDKTGEKTFETGVNHGVLYLKDSDGKQKPGVVWNGLTAVNESPGGAEASPIYADNIKYLNMTSAETFAATIEAYTYPDEFADCDGSREVAPGAIIGQQPRVPFGFSYETIVGDDINEEAGIKLHILFNCKAAPSERSYGTKNESPEAIQFSWELSTTPVPMPGNNKPSAYMIIDSRKVEGSKWSALLEALYGKKDEGGSEDVEGKLLTPQEIIDIIK